MLPAMPHKIAMIGAGSVVFGRNLTGDFLHHPEFADATLCYMDVDAERLEVGAALCRKTADALGVSPRIEATTSRRDAVAGADFVVCMVQIGGFDSTLVDFEIPRKYGLNFTIADTTGPGGLFRALRTYPFMRDLARDVAEAADPDCWLLQYSNPMGMNMRSLLGEVPDLKAVGLCHSVQGTFAERMKDIGVDPLQAHFVCAGINHMAFYLSLRLGGEDLYPRLFAVADEMIEQGRDAVRYELMKRLGYAVTESSEHNAEYSAHFLPHDGLVERFGVPIDEYLRRCDGIVGEFERLVAFARSDEPVRREDVTLSHEYGSTIAHAVATGRPAVVYANVRNDGVLPDLPAEAIAEVATLVDRGGCRPTRVGRLPPQLVGYMMPHVIQQQLFVEAATRGRRDAVYQACCADPLTAATLPMDRIVEMCDELIAAQGMQKDGGVLPDLDAKKSLIPTSGKTFHPPTPAELRASWEKAKEKTSDEEAVETWRVAGPMPAEKADELLKKVLDGDDAGVEWREVAADADGRAAAVAAGGSNDTLGGGRHASVIAVANVDSIHDRDAPLRYGGDWNGNLWFNGQELGTRRGASMTVPLRAGDNRVVLRLNAPMYQAKNDARFGLFVRKANF